MQLSKKSYVFIIGTMLVAIILSTPNAHATSIGYLTGSYEPWHQTNSDNMNAAFGAGSWNRLYFSSFNSNQLANYDFLYIDGSDGIRSQFYGFMNSSNINALQNWVSNGGRVFINAADPYSGTHNMGFGIALRTQQPAYRGYAVGGTNNPLVNGPGGYAGASWTGSYIALSFVLGSGLENLITDEYHRLLLGGKSFGTGYVMVGGMTDPYYHSSRGQALRTNILSYTYQQGQRQTPVPEPMSMLLMGSGLAGIAALKRKPKAQL